MARADNFAITCTSTVRRKGLYQCRISYKVDKTSYIVYKYISY